MRLASHGGGGPDIPGTPTYTRRRRCQKRTFQRRCRSRCVCFAGVGAGAAVLALTLALHHPLSASTMVGAVLVWAAVAAVWPHLWLALLPAVLPLANLSPWTGWVVVEELDLFVLATVAAANLRLAWRPCAMPAKLPMAARLWIGAFVASTVWALWSGWQDAAPSSVHLFHGHLDALNGIRVAKSGLLLPLDEQTARWRYASRAIAYAVGAALLLYLVLDEWGTGAALLVLLALAAAWALAWRRAATRRQRTLGAELLALALLFEAVLMFGPDGFMSQRSAASARDYASRTEHWARGLALLDSPAAWLLGIGLGRLPARYDMNVPNGEVPGHAAWQCTAPQSGNARLEGPRSREELAGRHGLTQRVAAHARYSVLLDWRAEKASRLLVRVCESHLLYVRNCQWAILRHPGGDSIAWRTVEATLHGPPLSKGPVAWAPRQTVVTLSVLDVGAVVDVDNIALRDGGGSPLLDNADFSRDSRIGCRRHSRTSCRGISTTSILSC